MGLLVKLEFDKALAGFIVLDGVALGDLLVVVETSDLALKAYSLHFCLCVPHLPCVSLVLYMCVEKILMLPECHKTRRIYVSWFAFTWVCLPSMHLALR